MFEDSDWDVAGAEGYIDCCGIGACSFVYVKWVRWLICVPSEEMGELTSDGAVLINCSWAYGYVLVL